MQHLTELTYTISQRLSPAELRSYAHLMREFRFRRIDRQEVIESVVLLLEHDQDLLSRFLEVVYNEFSLSSAEEDEEEELQEGDDDVRDGTKSYQDFDLNQECISSDVDDESPGGNHHHDYGNDEHHDDDDGNQSDEKRTGNGYDHDGGHVDDHHDHRDDDKMSGNRSVHLRDDEQRDVKIDDKKTGDRDDHQSYSNDEHNGGYDADDEKTESKATVAAVDKNPKEDVSTKDGMNMVKLSDLYKRIKKNKGIYEELTKTLMPNREKKLAPHELKHEVLSVLSDRHDLRNEILEIIDDAELITRQEAVRPRRKRNKSKPIKDWEQVTPSYRLIPEENQSLDPDPDPELNNKYVSVGRRRGRWWYQKRRSLHEKAMFQCEEEMYETDMLRGTLQRVVEKAEKVLQGKMKIEDVGIMFYRCIERMYGELGAETVEQVKKEPQKALRVILPRLKRKLRDLTLVLEAQKPIWKQVFQEHSKKQEDSTARPKKLKIA